MQKSLVLKPMHSFSSVKRIIAVGLFGLAGITANAQNITNYSFTTGTETYTNVTGGTSVATATSVAAYLVDDAISVAIPLGFSFTYMGISYTNVYASTNGFISFNPLAGSVFTNNMLTSAAAQRPLIAPLWDDLGGSTGSSSYITTGSPGSRIFTIEWKDWKWNNGASTAVISFKARLYEATGVIEYVYDPLAGPLGGTPSASIGITGTPTGSGNILSLSDATASPTISSTVETATISLKPSSGQLYRFTPSAVATAAPINFSATAVNAFNTTINFVDNSTDEAVFEVLRSTNPLGPFVSIGAGASTTVLGTGTLYSLPTTGLTASTTYYYQIIARKEGPLSNSTPLTGTQATTGLGNITSTATGGLWSATSTWIGGVIPTNSDNVTIADGSTVVLDVTGASAFSLVVGTGLGSPAILETDNGVVSRSLTVSSDLTVSSFCFLRSTTINPGSSVVHNLTVNGNMTVNGTFNGSQTTNSKLNLTFTGATNNSFTTGASSGVSFNTVTINKGISNTNTLEFFPGANWNALSGTQGFLLSNGTLKISGSATIANQVFNSTTYSIPLTAGFWLNNLNFTVTGLAGSNLFSGLFRLSAGTMNVGTLASHGITSSSASTVIIEGGVMNVAARMVYSSSASFNMTAGILNISTVGNSTSSSASFGFTSTLSVFSFTGGTINLVQASTGATQLDYNVATLAPVMGGTLNVGTAATVTKFSFRGQGAFPNTIINNTTNNKTLTLSGTSRAILGFLISSGTTLDLGFSPLNILGTSITNNGIITGVGSGARLAFLGSAAQTFAGTGTITGYIDGLIFNNSFGTTISHTNNIPTLRVLLQGGTVTNSNKITIGTGAALATFVEVGASLALTPGGNFDVAPVFNLGTGTIQLSYLQESIARTTGFEVPTSRTLTTLVINNTNGVTVSGGLLAATTVTLTNGKIATSASNLLTVLGTTAGSISAGSLTSYVDGPMTRSLPASLTATLTYVFPVGKGSFNPFSLVNPTTTSGGSVSIRAEVFDANAGGTPGASMGLINSNRYWAVSIATGAANYTSSLIRLSEATPGTADAVSASSTLNGAYNLVGGNTTTIAAPLYTSTAPALTTLPGFFALGAKGSPEFNTLVISPSAQQCVSTARTVTVNVVQGGGAISTVILNYSINGGTAIANPMTFVSGNQYAFTIPIVTPSNATVTYNIVATDVNSLSKTIIGTPYSDNPLLIFPIVLSATPNPVCAGDSVTLSGLINIPSTIQLGTQTITEFGGSTYRYGGGLGQFRHHMLYSATELQAAGFAAGNILNGIRFVVSSVGSGAGDNYTIRLANVASTALTASFLSPTFIQVYTVPSYTAVLGDNNHNFTTNFTWDGVSNILVEVCYTVTVGGGSSTAAATTPAVISNMNSLAGAISCGAVTGTTYLNRPLTAFSKIAAGITYLWKDISGATVATTNTFKAAPLASTKYFFTANALGCNKTDSVSITVNPKPTAPTASNSSQCGTGIPTAFVTSTSGAPTPTFAWYASNVATVALQSGTSSTFLAAVSATTTFFVAEIGANACPSPRVAVIIDVLQPDTLTITSSALPSNCANSTYTVSVAQTGPNANNYALTLSASSYIGSGLSGPISASLNTPISITPTAAGTYIYTITGVDGICTRTSSVTVVVINPLNGVTAFAFGTPNPVCTGSATVLSVNLGSAVAPNYILPPAIGNPLIDEDFGNITITQGATTILNNTSAINALTSTIGTASGVAGSYSDFTAFGPYNLSAGQTYNLSVSSLTTGTPFGNVMAVFIDYNRDGDFNDVGETVYASPASIAGAHQRDSTFTVPTSAFNGNTRMRIFAIESTVATGPTQVGSWGEYEEYSVNISGSAFSGGGFVPAVTSYSWSDGATVVGTTNNLSVIPTAPTTYTVTVNVNGCTTTASTLVNLLAVPTVVSTTPAGRCGQGTVDLGATGSGSSILIWYAAATGGLALDTGIVFTTPSISAITTFYVSALENGCPSPRVSVLATVEPISLATTIVYNSTAYCLNTSTGTVVITGEQGGIFSSTAGLTINSADGTIDPTTSTPGTYVVTYTKTPLFCPVVTASQTIVINALPVSGFSYASSDLCTNSGVAAVILNPGASLGVFTADPAGLTLNASTGSVTLSSSAVGTYEVTNTVSSAGCANSVSKDTITINQGVVITLQPSDASVLPNDNVTFTSSASGTGVSNQWYESIDNGFSFSPLSDGGVYSGTSTSTLVLTGVDVSFNSYQYYNQVSGAAGCSSVNSDTVLLSVGDAAFVLQPVNASACNTGVNTASFTVSTSGVVVSLQWEQSTDNGVTFTPLSDGTVGGVTYSGTATTTLSLSGLSLTNNNYKFRSFLNGAVASNAATLTVFTEVAIVASPINSSVCTNASTNLTVSATGSGLSYQWQLFDGSVFNNVLNGGIYSGVTTASLGINSPAIGLNGSLYQVIVSGAAPCAAVTSASAVLTVNPLPVLDAIGGLSAVCINGSITLTNTTAGGSYTTSTPTLVSVNSTTGVVNGLAAGTATVTYSFTDGNGCTNTISKTLTVNPLPVVAPIVGGVPAICVNATTTWTNTTGGGVWSSSDTLKAKVTNGLVLGVSAGTAVISYTFTNGNGCIGVANRTITVNPSAVISISASSTSFCNPGGTTITLVASGATSHVWSPTAGLFTNAAATIAYTGTNLATVYARPGATITYTATGPSSLGCVGSATRVITVSSGVLISSVVATPASACSGSNSQLTATAVAPYTFAASTAAYDTLFGAAQIINSGNDDTPTPALLTIGFPFDFSGTSYTQYSVSPDGFIKFGSPVTTSQFSNAVTSTTNIPKIYPYWDDLATGTTGNVKTLLSGTAPNRILKVEWFVTAPRNLTGPADSRFQAWMYEGTNVIEYRYGTFGALTAGSASAGYTVNATNFQSITLATNSSNAGVANNANALAPVAGTLYTFTPSVINYSWTPTTFLSNANISNPVATGITATTVYTVTASVGSGCTSTSTATVTVLPLPSTPTSVGSAQCGSAIPTASVASTSGATTPTFRWYNVATGGTALQSSTSLTFTTAISTTTTFYVAELGTNGCESARVAVIVNVTQPDALVATTTSNSVCAPSIFSIDFTQTGSTNNYTGNLFWSALPAAGSGISTPVAGVSGTPISVSPTAPGTYVYKITGTDGSCVSTSSVTVVFADPFNGVVVAGVSSPSPVCLGSATNLSVSLGSATIPASYTLPPTVVNPTVDEDLGNITITSGATTILNNSSVRNSLVGTIGTATGVAGSYANYTSFGPYSLTAGATYGLSLSSLQSTTAFGNAFGLYIDYNRNGVFTDAGEAVYLSTATVSGAHTQTSSFTVPAGALNGTTRMRVISNEGLVTSSTQSVTYGEYEEYLINLVSANNGGGSGPAVTSVTWSDGSTVVGTGSPLAVTPLASTTYNFTAFVGACSVSGTASVVVNPIPAAPSIAVVDSCGSSRLTASSYSGSLVWSNGQTTPSILVTTAGVYTVQQNVNGCLSPVASATAAPIAAPVTPTITVVNNCGSSVLTASNFTGSLLWSTGQTTTSITVSAAGAYTLQQTVAGCKSLEATGLASPNSSPVAPTASSTSQPTCLAPSSGVITVTAPTGAGFTYSIGGAYQASGTFNNLSSGAYNVTAQNSNGCISNITVVNVNAIPAGPAAPTASVTTQPTPSVPTGVITVSGPTGAGITYSVGGPYQSSGVFSGLAPGTTFSVTARNNDGCISTASSVSVNAVPPCAINPANAVVFFAGTRCGVGNVALEVTNPSGATSDWYAAATGGLPLKTGSQYYTASQISVSTTYYVQTRNRTTGCISLTRTPITATVNPLPLTAVGTGASLCTSGSVTISATAGVNETIDWYSLPSGGVLLASGSFTYATPALSSNATYYAQARNTVTGCLARSRAYVTATIGTVADPVVVVQGTRCGEGQFALEVSVPLGATNDWYTTPTGGTPIRSNTLYYTTPVLTTTTVYYAEARNRVSGCVSGRTAVTVSINPLPAVAVVIPASLCGSGSLTLGATVPSGITTDWYSAASGGTLLASGTASYTTPVLNSSTTYFVQARNETTGCLSSSRVPVTATVGIVPAPTSIIPGTGGSGTRCGAGRIELEVSSAVGTKTSWYANPTGGVALKLNSNYFTTPSISVTTTYYAEAVNTISGCVSPTRTAVTATISCPPPRIQNTIFNSTEAVVYPNPNQGEFSIKITSTDRESSAIIQIRDVAGRLIMEQLNNVNVNGIIELNVNRRELPSGFYTANYLLGTERGSVKFVIVQ